MGDVAAALTWPLTRPPIQSGGRMYELSSARIGRCLFGPVDHEQVKSTLQEYQKDLLEKNKLEWNFDFENGRPISGRYKWMKVGDPPDADSNGGSATQDEEKKPAKLEQTKITDFMRKRKSSSDDSSSTPKRRRRST